MTIIVKAWALNQINGNGKMLLSKQNLKYCYRKVWLQWTPKITFLFLLLTGTRLKWSDNYGIDAFKGETIWSNNNVKCEEHDFIIDQRH